MCLLFLLPCPLATSPVSGKDHLTGGQHKPEGTAIIITGAAARIPQEAALLENLYNKGMLKDVQFIAGASSGALNTVMLNAILTGRITWKEYLNLLFGLKDEDIYRRNGKQLPVDTSPLREFLRKVVNNTLEFYRIGDLPVASAISSAPCMAIN